MREIVKRLGVYCREMYPLFPRLLLGVIIFGEIYFIVLLNYGIADFRLGFQEVIGAYTVFAFLFILRIADDIKDYKLDCRLFADRPLPSGRVKKTDLAVLLCFMALSSAVTYSSIFGYKKATRFILVLTLVDIATNVLLVVRLNRISIAALLLNAAWMTLQLLRFMKDPRQFRIVDKVERYTYFQESIMLITVPVYLLAGKI